MDQLTLQAIIDSNIKLETINCNILDLDVAPHASSNTFINLSGLKKLKSLKLTRDRYAANPVPVMFGSNHEVLELVEIENFCLCPRFM